MYCGIDVGFSDTKIVFKNSKEDNNYKYFKISSAVSYSSGNNKEDIFFKNKNYKYLDRYYFVGEDAVFDSISNRNFEFLQKYTPLLIYVGLKQSNIEKITRSGLGLPLNYYKLANVEALLKSIKETPIEDELLDIGNIKVFPQGVGILLDYILNHQGSFIEENKLKSGIVVDIGYNTVDVVAFEKGIANKEKSNMFERYGISKLINKLSNELQLKYDITLNDYETRDIFLKGYIPLYGKNVEIKPLIAQLVEIYADEVINIIKSKWDDVLRRSDILILAGGGAYYIKDYVPEKYKNLIKIPHNPEYANARGYLKGNI
jgi:plasmid segregation protein ParM